MKPQTWLRIASALTLIHAVMHTIGGVFGKPVPGVATTVAAAMQANRFVVYGVTRSYADFYFGLGMGITIFLTATAGLLWQLSRLKVDDLARLRPVLATLAITWLAFAINSALYFFWAPVVFEIIIAACIIASIARTKPVWISASVGARA